MKKIYNTPALEITNIQIMQMIAESIPVSSEEGTHIAESKAINFADENMWGDEE